MKKLNVNQLGKFQGGVFGGPPTGPDFGRCNAFVAPVDLTSIAPGLADFAFCELA